MGDMGYEEAGYEDEDMEGDEMFEGEEKHVEPHFAQRGGAGGVVVGAGMRGVRPGGYVAKTGGQAAGYEGGGGGGGGGGEIGRAHV